MSFKKEPQKEETLEDVGLTIRTRINIQYLLGQGINSFQKAIVKQEGVQSKQEVMEAAIGLFEMIPDQWRIADATFQKEIKEAIIVKKIDTRKKWCGVPTGQTKFKLIKQFNPYRLFHLCMNLFARRGLLARTIYEEIATGKQFQELEETKIEEEKEESSILL